MDYQEYFLQVKDKFINTTRTNIGGFDALVIYDEVFKWRWLATKLKIFSFVTYADKIDEHLIKSYTQNCLHYACKHKKGLPRGLQNGVVSYSILVSDNIDSSAISFVSQRPTKHWSAFEMPILVDLSKKELYYYKENMIWGALYDSFLNEYILRNFKF
ncbi:hypothetical protein Ami103574_06530 [Aminipila butyrica]|uniref:Uncharacterized protein n=1 Tax=Aminipila butyrica TaxID=433296 RepID=A0A858BUY4_9FIRM|nr:hypothetical protein [Aminipila butyrica]QIB68999.1 hypothetical protein Ami103574_06530 [Aminipila butyrica]